jgi:hypothetical protein
MFWIEGWIEVAYPETPWFGVVNLGKLIEIGCADSGRLFGLSKQYLRGEDGVEALFPSRGVPSNPSAEVVKATQGIAAYEAEHGGGEFGGYTHATWAEIRDYIPTAEPEETNQWKLVFDLTRVLEQRYAPERIRFVIWFNW